MLKEKTLLLILLLATTVFFGTATNAFAAQTLDKPNVNIPYGWILKSETQYPNMNGIYDPQGAGLVTYENPISIDFVMIFYENFPEWNNSGDYLDYIVNESKALYQAADLNEPITDSGTMTISGVPAGYAKGYNPTSDLSNLQLVFVKNGVFFDVFAKYHSTTEATIISFLNSILPRPQTSSITEPTSAGWLLYFIIVVVIAAVTIVGIGLVRKRKKVFAQPPP